jgi:hypothetical protein
MTLFAVAVLWSTVLGIVVAARNRAVAASERAQLEATGLALSGDPLGPYVVSARAHGVDIVVENGGGQRAPGAQQEETRAVCLVRVGARLADQLVCAADRADSVMGPLPAAPRVATGDAAFDAAYATFVSVGAPDGAIAWAERPTLDAMRALGLVWMRVQGGKCEVAFEPLAAADVPRAVAVGARLAGGPLSPRDAPSVRAPRAERRSSGAAAVWVLAAIGALGGIGLAFAQPLMDLDSATECPPGSRLTTESHGDGDTSLICWSGPWADTGIRVIGASSDERIHYRHYAGCCVLTGASVALLGLLVATILLPFRFARGEWRTS